MPYADPDKQREFQKYHKRATKTWFWEYKENLACERCGFDNAAALHFHHPKGRKGDPVSRMVNKNVSRVKIMDEIDLCEIICANCHAVEHFEKYTAHARDLK